MHMFFYFLFLVFFCYFLIHVLDLAMLINWTWSEVYVSFPRIRNGHWHLIYNHKKPQIMVCVLSMIANVYRRYIGHYRYLYPTVAIWHIWEYFVSLTEVSLKIPVLCPISYTHIILLCYGPARPGPALPCPVLSCPVMSCIHWLAFTLYGVPKLIEFIMFPIGSFYLYAIPFL